MSEKRDIPLATLTRQALASDPKNSAWVSANAGSGKTHVLAQRVIRLLLAGVKPGRILCLTFTKAAAANMSERVFKNLAQWSALDDSALADAIAATGADRPTDKGQLAFARKLFARAVETPGGLKIQTLHAFCEKILHAAPFEANVAASFSVLEDAGQAELLTRAKAEALAHAQADGALAGDLDIVAFDAGLNFDKLLKQAVGKRVFFRALAAPGAEARFRAVLGLAADETVATIHAEILASGLAPQRRKEIASLIAGTGARNDELAERLTRSLAHWRQAHHEDALAAYMEAFFTAEGQGSPRKTLLYGAPAKKRPDILEALEAEQARLDTLREKIAAIETAVRSLALAHIVNTILDRYEALKAERQWLDFDDLITRTRELLSRSSAGWALYKLDAGIDHILVDEAQDTSEAQWDILNRLSGDFFAGEGQASRDRTLFVVGDEKQSIFSFQGAEPRLFDQTRRDVAKRARDVGKPFEEIPLTLSFRSAPGVLEAVDMVFAAPERFRGLSAAEDATKTVHEALKRNAPSRVEIWDVLAPQEREVKRDWRLPVDFRDAADPAIASARRIAQTIWLWLDEGESLGEGESRRRIRPGDIMILVRKRDAFFEAMIRALKEAGVPVAGADRLQLAEHIAVMDLVAIGRAALLPEDDLTLATALKTPFFGLDDDDLLKLSPRRPGALIDALRGAAEEKYQAAAALLDLLGRMGRALPPFGFYARLLGPRGGRRAFLARLGPEAGDAIDEFLNLALAHERARAPSLPAFLAEIEALDASIKRDMESGDSFVRVMTAHAAKGLEGKIVFLPDVCGAPSGRHDGGLFPLETSDGQRFMAWSPREKADCAAVAESRAARRAEAEDEYRRLLYVALTRAEERIYVAGHRGKAEVQPQSWRGMIEAAWDEALHEAPSPWGGLDNVRRLGPPQPEAPPAPEMAPPRDDRPAAPAWMTMPAPSEHAVRPPLRPSSALDGAEERGGWAPSEPQRARALEEGRLIHLLLQHLPDLPREARAAVAKKQIERQGLGERTEEIIRRVLDLLDDPRLAPLFGPASVAEVRLAAKIALPDGRHADISGAIDRLAETPEGVWIADYKTGAPAPGHAAQIALYRAAAKLLYPGRPLRCFLIYTSPLTVDELAPERLDAALAALAD
jgi:ATP-dependent helicase/nuclease subunit A